MSKKQSFKKTSIPYKGTDGKPMKYHIVDADGNDRQVSRTECIGSGDNPKLHVDVEAGIVVRLPDNAESENLARLQMQDNWKEAKRKEREIACMHKNTQRCGGRKDALNEKHTCESCHLYTKRTAEIDKPLNESTESTFDITDSFDTEATVMDKMLLEVLEAALSILTDDERLLITEIFYNEKSERQITSELGLKQPKSVNKRKHRILEKLRKNATLKSFYEN